MYSLFVFGAPHNKKGFELTVLEGNRISNGIFKYIDIYNPDKMRDGNTFVIQTIHILKKDYTLLAKYVGINPSDQKTSRGSYIAVGVLVESPVSLSSSIIFLSKITNFHSSLKMMRDERNAFKTTFDMSKDLQNIKMKCDDVAFLANLTHTISNLNETKKVIFNDIVHSESITDIDNNLIINEIENQKKLINQYQEELKDEKEAYKITRTENEQEIDKLQSNIKYLEDELNLAKKNEYTLKDELNLAKKNKNTLKDTENYLSLPANDARRPTPNREPVNRPRDRTSFPTQKEKKRFSLISILLYIIMLILLIFTIYFAFEYFTSSDSEIPEVIENNSHIEHTVELIPSIQEDSAKETVVTEEPKTGEVTDVDIIDIKQEIEETPLEEKKAAGTLEELRKDPEL